MSNDEEITLPLIEESLSIDKVRVSDGRVRVTTETEVVTEIANMDVSSETVSVTRVAVEAQVDDVPQVRIEGNITIIPVLEERMVIEKRLFLVEEIRIERTTAVEEIEVPVDLLKQTARIDRTED